MDKRRPRTAITQLALTWLVGSLSTALVLGILLVAVVAAWSAGHRGGTANGLLILALVVVLAVPAVCYAVVAGTREASVLGGSGAQRALWAFLVFGGGLFGWLLGWAMCDALGLRIERSPGVAFLASGLPYALVAGVFLRGWAWRGPPLAICVALLVATCAIPGKQVQVPLDDFLTTAGINRDTTYVVSIPGYVPVGQLSFDNRVGGGDFVPADPNSIPPDRFVTIQVYSSLYGNADMCGQPSAMNSDLIYGDCTVEPDGLVYRRTDRGHGYQVPVGDRWVEVVGTLAIDHDIVRNAVLTLRPATPADIDGDADVAGLLAADVPGFVGSSVTAGRTVYEPADRTGDGHQAVHISLLTAVDVDPALACIGAVECTPEAGGVIFLRYEDRHGYVARHGRVNVTVLGGPLVDAALLRRAAVDARQVTDDELRTLVPAAPPARPAVLERLQKLLPVIR